MVFGLLPGLASAEIAYRVIRPMPPMQLVRGYGLRLADGVPIWEYATDRYNRGCVAAHPERTRVLFFGSSITYGSGLSLNEAFTTALEARLNAARPSPGFCVLNFAQCGFSFEQKHVVARRSEERR